MFLIRTSCSKITRANGYCLTWPGQVVSGSVFSNSFEDNFYHKYEYLLGTDNYFQKKIRQKLTLVCGDREGL